MRDISLFDKDYGFTNEMSSEINKVKNKGYYGEEGYPVEFAVSVQPQMIEYRIEIDGLIESVSQFSTAIRILGMAKENDSVIIHLQSPGGSLNATDAFLHAMRNCDANIHIIATGNCSSAATFILLEADSFHLSDGFNALLHCGSLGAGGNYNEFKPQAVFFSKYMEKTLRAHYEGFLTEEEMVAMLDGKDILLDAQDWCDRYKARYDYFVAKQKESENKVADLEQELAEIEKQEKLEEEETISMEDILAMIVEPPEKKSVKRSKNKIKSSN